MTPAVAEELWSAWARPTTRTPVPLGASEFRTLRDFLYERSGLHFAESKKFLLDARIHRRLQTLGVGGASEYLELLRSPEAGPGELLELLDAVTTHETSFFRTEPQIEAFRRHALPELLDASRRRGERTLKIWSAACSSGEEPYTLAMVLLEVLGREALGWRLRILGTDVARSVLRKAETAVYGAYSLRNTPPSYRYKYFERAGPDTYRLKDGPRQLVEFDLVNFADDVKMRALGGFQVVFCRNALIYFDSDAKRRFVAHFAAALEAGGYLFVGHSESLHSLSAAFDLVHFPDATAYRKPAPGVQRRSPWTPIA